jgi:hypothetical protein
MGLFRAGFFRELRHGDSSGPSIEEVKDKLPVDKRKGVARYLHAGARLAVTGQNALDWFAPSKIAGPLALYTDGVWVWPAELAYYVENYGVAVPVEMIEWMEKRAFNCPPLSHDELLKVEELLFST